MKIKDRTRRAFATWCESHKMSDTFVFEGKPMKGSEFLKILRGETVKTVEPKVTPKLEDPVNIDIQEEEHADMGQSLDDGNSEEY